MSTMATEIASGEALKTNYRVCERVGTVQHSETRSETEVTGSVSGGGGASYGGTGYNAPVQGSIQSKTTRFQTIFLKDDDGDEHVIELENFLIPCKPEQRLSMFIVKVGKDSIGPYFHAYNHNTRQASESAKALRNAMFPFRAFAIGMGVILTLAFLTGFSGDGTLGDAIIALIVMGLIGGLILGAAGGIVALFRAMTVRRNPGFKKYLAGLVKA